MIWLIKFLARKFIQHFVFDRRQQKVSLIVLTIIIAPSLGFFLDKGGADPWQLVILCFVLSTLFLTIPIDHGEVFARIGFKFCFTGILIIIAYGTLDTGFKNLSIKQSAANGFMAFAGMVLVLVALIMLSWSMGEIFLESARKIQVKKV